MKAGKQLSWGNYPYHPQQAHVAEWRDTVAPELRQLSNRFGSALPFGSGRSYGDSCLAASDQVLALRQLNRIIAADWSAGILRVEAGATLEEILRLAIPRGWFLPVVPGTRYVTVGGALANDVHGKNHHRRGTFGLHVKRFGLLRSDRGALDCSPGENPELFAATIGGLGLTGIVLWAELQLLPVRSSRVASTSARFGNLAEFFALSNEHDSSHEYTVAWIDCLARGKNLGRGIFTLGDHADDEVREVRAGKKLAVPFMPPFSLINPLSLRAFNTLYYHRHPRTTVDKIVDHGGFFFPLDAIAQWNRMYGPKGFQQYQCVVPEAGAQAAIGSLLEAIAAQGSGSFLAVLKRCGGLSSPGLLSFPLPGVSLALDFPQQDAKNEKLFARMDSIIREAGGRLYPAKDAHMSGSDFRRSYPAWQQVELLRDPALLSRFWQRTALA